MNDSIARVRLTQAQNQVHGILDRRVGLLAQLATYKDHDPLYGDRLLTMPDGGVIRQNWETNSVPVSIPGLTIPSKQVGLSGFTTQKPA